MRAHGRERRRADNDRRTSQWPEMSGANGGQVLRSLYLLTLILRQYRKPHFLSITAFRHRIGFLQWVFLYNGRCQPSMLDDPLMRPFLRRKPAEIMHGTVWPHNLHAPNVALLHCQ
jgi:hypothetical protein